MKMYVLNAVECAPASNEIQDTIICYLTDGYNVECFESHVLFEFRKAQSWRKGGLNNKYPRVKQKISFRKLLAGHMTIEVRYLATFVCIMERKWNDQLDRTEGE